MFNVDGSSDISFITTNESGADFWNMEPSDDYAADCQRGREAALELQREMFFGQSPNLLGSVMRAIIGKGRFSGLEAGFCHQIGECLVASPTL